VDDDQLEDATEAHEVQVERRPAEGVRIIGADEAAAAIEAGQVAPRRPEDAPRFGDVPSMPSGPRPPLRFPYPGDEPPAVAKPPLVPPAPTLTDSGSVPLPHWTDPPTGEVPKILPDSPDPDPVPADGLDAWSTLAGGPRWRDQPGDWEEGDFDASVLHDEESRFGALDTSDASTDNADDDLYVPPAPSPVAAEAMAEQTQVASTVTQTRRPPSPGPAAPAGPRDVRAAVATGAVLGAVVLVAAAAAPALLVALTGVVLVMGTAEMHRALRVRGYQPATLLGLVAAAATTGAVYWRGEDAVPLMLAMFMVFCLLWYLAGVTSDRPAINVAGSVMSFVYIGFLGSFAALLLRLPRRHGVAFFLGAVIATAAYDIGAFVVGRWAGKTPIAPNVSPGKTWEGLLGASLATLVVCLVVVRGISPWNFGRAFLLAVVVVVAAPLGDLCESMIKRDLAVKDMGSVLPGHGGVLDRIDSLLFVIPAVYYLVRALKIA